MSRLLVTAVLVPTLLLSQWVGAFRCDGCKRQGPEGQPHVHLNELLPTTASEAGCPCHRHRPDTAPERPPGAASAGIAAFTPPHECGDSPAQSEMVLMLPANADWGVGDTADPSAAADTPPPADGPIPSATDRLGRTMPLSRQLESATPTFPVGLAMRSLRI